jgi:hypothetical protein
MSKEQRQYFLSMPQLIDRLCIVTLKSIKISDHKKEYEEEAKEIMHDLDLLLGKNQGKFIRAVLLNGIVNETMWSNESQARQGNDTQGKRLLFTHSLNSVRNASTNAMASLFEGRKDLKLDYMSPELTKEFGYDFDGVLDD